MLNKLISLIQH